MTTSARVYLPSLIMLLALAAAGRGASAGETAAAGPFKALEAAFPGQFSFPKDAASPVEFCPDNTCFAFARGRGVSDEDLAGFVYLYLFYSSDYAATAAWQSKPESAAAAVTIAARLAPSCRGPAGPETALCAMNAMISGKAVRVYDVRYDENERSAVPVLKAVLGHTGEVQACRAFAESFVAWYVPLALKNEKEPASVLAIRRKPAIFSDRLRKSLEEDRKAQEAAAEIVGIDFDPFLSSQDPAAKYLVGKVTVEDGKCLADIKAAGAVNRAWDVRAEAKRSAGAWRFTNFHYNTDVLPNDLLSDLRDLARGRAAAPAVRPGK